MAVHALTNCKVFVDGYDFTSKHNAVNLQYKADLLDNTTMGMDTRSRKAGLKDAELNMQGFWEAGTTGVDTIHFANVGTSAAVISVAPTGGAIGEKIYTFQNVASEYSPGAQIGNLLSFNYVAMGQGDLVRGTVGATGEKTTTANGTAYELGAASATQKLYGILHVYAVSGTNPTLDVVIAGDSQEDFGGTPATQITFTQKTAIGVQWATPISGALADTWWRAQWTIGGTDTPTFSFVVIIGIQ